MDLKEAILTAIKGEIEGRMLYRMAADKMENKKAKEIFTMLADEEQGHLNSLIQVSKEYEGGKELCIPGPPSPTRFADAESPIFTDEFKENADFNVSALSIGIKLELESEKFYRDAAKDAKQQSLREFFERLADWEKGHYEFLSKQYRYFDDYFVNRYRHLVAF